MPSGSNWEVLSTFFKSNHPNSETHARQARRKLEVVGDLKKKKKEKKARLPHPLDLENIQRLPEHRRFTVSSQSLAVPTWLVIN